MKTDSMTDEPDTMREVHDIHLQMYEESKGMTREEWVRQSRAESERIAEEFGLIIVDSIPAAQDSKAIAERLARMKAKRQTMGDSKALA
jgi:3-dehydroquinate synthase class II